MTYPTVNVEVAFTSDPLDPAPSYTDVSDKVFSVETVIGRSEQFAAYDTGTATVAFDNTDRLFDPLHDTGSYYGDLLPNKRIRISADYGGTTYELYTGHVDGWPQSYDHDGTSVSTVEAKDAFKLLARQRMPQDRYGEEVLADSPRLWYRLDDTVGTRIQDYSGNDRHGVAAADTSLVATEGLLNSVNGGVSLDVDLWECKIPKEHVAFDFDPCTVEFWFRCDRPPQTEGINGIIAGVSDIFGPGLSLDIFVNYTDEDGSTAGSPTPGGFVTFGIVQWVPSAAVQQVSATAQVCDGNPHHIMFTRSGSTLKVYVDGFDRTGGTYSTGTFTATAGNEFSLNIGYNWAKWAGASNPVLDEFAMYDTALSEADALRHYQAGRFLWDGDHTGERVTNILDAVSWPAALADIDTGQTVLGPAQWEDGTMALDLCRLAESSEQGAFYCDHANGGVLRFRGRTDFLTAARTTTSQATFSDENGASNVIRYSTLELVYDDSELVNKVDVVWVGGTATVSDQTSIDTYGEQSKSIETLMPTRADAESLASWVLHHYADAFTRVRSITVNPGGQSGDYGDHAWEQVLGREIGDRITVIRHPQSVGNPISQQVIIEGIEHTIDSGVNGWTTTFRCGPAESTTYWILGTSELGTETRLAF